MQRRRKFLKNNWPYFFTTAAPLILFAPFLLGRAVLYWGTPFFQFYPWRKFAFDMIRAGQIPLWNPYLGNGAPLIANYQSAIFYPPNWLSLILSLAYAFSWLTVLHLIWAGAGMVAFARSLGLKPFGQAVAGLAFGVSQFLVAKAADSARADALAWIPWILWAADQFLLSKKKAGQPLFYFTLFAALQLLAGHAQTAWYTYLLLAAWTLYRLFANRIHLSKPFILGASLILAAGLVAIQLIPTAEFLLNSQRSSEYGAAAMVYSYSPPRLLTLFAPDFFGNPARGLFFGYGIFYEDAGYIGVLPLTLALGLLFSRIKLPRRSGPEPDSVKSIFPNSLIAFLAATMLVSFVLGLGANTPIFPFLYHYVPTFNMFQAPTRFMVWFAFSLALLAGIAAHEWTPPQNKKLYWTRLGLAGAFTLTLIAAGIYFAFPSTGKIGGQIHSMAGASALAGFLLTISTILALTQPAPDSPRRAIWMTLAVGFIALDLIYANWGINPPAPPDIYTPLPASGDNHRIYESGVDLTRFLAFDAFGPPALAVEAHQLHLANTNMLDGVASFNNYDPLKENRYSILLNALQKNKSDHVLQLADVGAKIVSGEKKSTAQLEAAAKTPSRVWAVTSSMTVDNAEAALSALFADTFDPAETVILEKNDPGTVAAHPIPFGAAQSSSAPVIIESQPNDVKINASMPRDGWIVLSDTYYPGWYVYVDGQPAKLLRADYAFRGVAVPAGDHVVEFRYEPLSFRLGAWITGISSLLFISLIFASDLTVFG